MACFVCPKCGFCDCSNGISQCDRCGWSEEDPTDIVRELNSRINPEERARLIDDFIREIESEV